MANPTKGAKRDEIKVLARNRKALHDYDIDEKIEVGVVLTGSEVKSARGGHVLIADAHAEVREGELWLFGVQIAEYAYAHGLNHEVKRMRKLLAHRREIERLYGKVREKSYTLIPISIYLKDGKVKVELALAKGRREYDKRDIIRAKEEQREAAKAMRRR